MLWYTSPHFILTAALWGRYYNYPPVIANEQTEAQKDEVTCFKLPSQLATETLLKTSFPLCIWENWGMKHFSDRRQATRLVRSSTHMWARPPHHKPMLLGTSHLHYPARDLKAWWTRSDAWGKQQCLLKPGVCGIIGYKKLFKNLGNMASTHCFCFVKTRQDLFSICS